MNYVLDYRAEARAELEDAYNWYEDQEAGLGEAFLDSFNLSIDRIRNRPESYAVIVGDLRRAIVKRFPYAIYYRIISSRVLVVAVLHGKRSPKHLRSRN
jgi:plasmid stabilization system protein ParE